MNVEKGFGAYFFVLLSTWQLLWITFLFFAFSTAADGLSNATSVSIFFGYLIIVLATLLQIIGFVFCLDSCHKSLRILSTKVQADILALPPGRAKEEAQCLLQVEFFSLSLVILLFRSWRAPAP